MKLIVALFVFLVSATSVARADVISVGPGAFPGGTVPITFTGLADGTEVNGLTVGGILFNYSLGNGHVIIDGGPGITNNVAPQNIVSIREHHRHPDTYSVRACEYIRLWLCPPQLGPGCQRDNNHAL